MSRIARRSATRTAEGSTGSIVAELASVLLANESMRTATLSCTLVLALSACASETPDTQTGSFESQGQPDARKLDRAFAAELAASTGLFYYDSVVTFRDRAGMARLATLGHPTNELSLLPITRVVLSADEIAEVTHWPEVRFVEPNRSLRLSNLEGRALTGADAVQELGFLGEGVEVAIIDTGADGAHDDLDDNMRRNFEVVGDGVFDTDLGQTYVSTTPDGTDVDTIVVDAHLANGAGWNTDDYGHGTHVFGTIAGTGDASEGAYRGMAPAATVDSYSTSAAISLFFVVQAYNHITESVTSNATDVRVVSNSWGSSGCVYDPDSSVNIATWTAYQAGILSVFAYGNDGPSADTCNPYATGPHVLGIAAADKAKKIAGFSSRGIPDVSDDREAALANLVDYHAASPAAQASWDHAARPLGLLRPSFSAPGVDIVSAQNPLHPMTLTLESYGAASGTSMATPHVSGIVALVVDAYESSHPGARLAPIDLIRLLEVTADKAVMFGYDTYETGAGFVDALAAVERAVAGDIPAAVSSGDLVILDESLLRVEGTPISGQVLANSWQTNVGHQVYDIVVPPGTFRVGAEVAWANDFERVYLTLYEPGVAPVPANATATSGALLNFATENSISYLLPEPGVWRVRVDGRVNLAATAYTGSTYTMFKDNAAPDAAITVSQTRIKPGDTVDVSATVSDADSVDDIADATLVLRDGRGKVKRTWTRDSFTVTDLRTLAIDVVAVEMTGKGPWTFTVSGVDQAGATAVAQAVIGRR